MKESLAQLRKVDVPTHDESELDLDELLRSIKAKRKEGGTFGRRRLRHFAELLSSKIFSLPEKVRDAIPSDDLIITTAQMTRMPETQGWLGHHMVGEVVRRLQTGDLDTDGLIEKTRQCPVSEIIDLVDCLRTVVISTGGFEEKRAMPVKQKINQLIQRLTNEHQCAFVNYAASIGLADTTNERSQFVDAEQPGRRFGKRKAGATAEESAVIDKVETIQLSHQIAPDIHINPADRLSRVSSDAIAVLDNTQTARAYGYFDPKEEAKKQPVKFIDYEDMAGDERANPFSKQDTDLPLLLQHLHNPAMRRRIEDDLGISLRELPLRAQIRLLEFLAEPRSNRFERLQKILQKHPEAGNDILMSFLSCAEDKSYGEAVLVLAETLSPAAVKQIFAKYTEIAGATEDIAGYIREQFGKEATGSETLKITQNLLRRGRELLAKYARDDNEARGKDVAGELEKCRADIWLFASAFKHLSEKEKLELHDIAGLVLETKDSGDLEERERREMRETFAGNRAEEGKEFVETRLKTEFDPVVNEPGHKFYILKDGETILSFARFDELENGNLYCGFINTRADIKGNSIGTAFLRTVFEKEADDKDVEIKVRTNNRMLRRYQEDFGFEVVGEYVDLKTKRKYLKLVRKAPSAKIADSEARSALG